MKEAFKFDEKTIRLRRNLLIVSLLSFLYAKYSIVISEISLIGTKIKIPVEAIELGIAICFFYLLITFFICVIEEIGYWRANHGNQELATWGGEIKQISLLDKIDEKLEGVPTIKSPKYDLDDVIVKIQDILEVKNKNEENSETLTKILSDLQSINNSLEYIKNLRKIVEEVDQLKKSYLIFWKAISWSTMIRLFAVDIGSVLIASIIGVYSISQFTAL